MTNPEQILAVAVIKRAVLDLKQDCRDEESRNFLLGNTSISRFWFQVADLSPLSPLTLDKFFVGGVL